MHGRQPLHDGRTLTASNRSLRKDQATGPTPACPISGGLSRRSFPFPRRLQLLLVPCHPIYSVIRAMDRRSMAGRLLSHGVPESSWQYTDFFTIFRNRAGFPFCSGLNLFSFECQRSQMAEALQRIGMLGAERSLHRFEGPAGDQLRFCQVAFVVEQDAKRVKEPGR